MFIHFFEVFLFHLPSWGKSSALTACGKAKLRILESRVEVVTIQSELSGSTALHSDSCLLHILPLQHTQQGKCPDFLKVIY